MRYDRRHSSRNVLIPGKKKSLRKLQAARVSGSPGSRSQGVGVGVGVVVMRGQVTRRTS